jgi:hypothetical protein
MVPDESLEQAIDVLDCWRRGDYRLEDDDECPRCHSSDIEEDPNYRGWAFFSGASLACFYGQCSSGGSAASRAVITGKQSHRTLMPN